MTPASVAHRPRGRVAFALLMLVAYALPAGALAQTPAAYVPDEVVVRYDESAGKSQRDAAKQRTGTRTDEPVAPRTEVVQIADGESVAETIGELERRDGVVSATPNWLAHASWVPNDPGRTDTPGGWRDLQWNLTGPNGINAPKAWDHLNAANRPGGSDVVVAVLDTGVAYRNLGSFRRSPDLSAKRFRRGYDFVGNDPYALDHNGHGTHVASTVIEKANNRYGLIGVAYGARVMPVRVLDRNAAGESADIAAGIRFAARRGADIINLSFEFDAGVRAGDVPEVAEALRYAYRKGAFVVAAAGNGGNARLAYPARSSYVTAVGATTESGCRAFYSNYSDQLDIAAPGGGSCADGRRGRDIFQVTLNGSIRRFGIPSGYKGTSMAAPHVSGVAALVIASGVAGQDPTPRRIRSHLQATARDLGASGKDPFYGSGLVDAAAATAPR